MKKYFKKIKFVILTLCFLIITKKVCFATGIQNLKMYTGTLKLINDLTVAFMTILPISCGLLIIIFQLMKMGADQNEAQIWKKRTKAAIIATIVGLSASGLISFVTSYFI